MFFSFSLWANDYVVNCVPWDGATNNFSLKAEVELTGGNYIDAWVTMNVYEAGTQIHTTKSTFSFGAFFIDMLRGKQVLIFELKPAGGQQDQFDYLSIAANHPLPSGNSWLTLNGKQYQAECFSNK